MKAKKLKNIKLNEISLVTSPANKQSFHFFKEKNMDELLKAYAELTGVEYTEEEIEVLKAISEENSTGITESISLLAGYKADMPEDMQKAVITLAGYATGKIPVSKSITDDEKEAIDYLEKNKDAFEEFEKAGKKLSKDTSAKITKAVEIAKKTVEDVAKISETLSPLLELETEKNEKVIDEKIDEDAVVEKTEDEIIVEPEKDSGNDEVIAKQVELEKTLIELQKSLTAKDSTISELTEKVEKLGKTIAPKQSLDTAEKTEDKNTSKFPSLMGIFQKNQDALDGM